MAATVLHIITGLGSGGAERMLTRIVLAPGAEDSLRHIVVTLMDEGIYGASLRSAGIHVYCLGMRRGAPSVGALWALVRILRRHRPQAIMTWLYHATLMGTIATIFAASSTKRIVWNLRGADMDFAQSSRMTRWVVRGLALLSPLPAIIAVNSRAGLNYHARLGYRSRRWAYLPNGFDLNEWLPDAADRIAIRAEWGFEENAVVVGMAARVDPQKDHPTLLAAAAFLTMTNDRLRYVLIGKDTEKLPLPASLENQVLKLGERPDVQKLLRGLDIAVLPSAFGEGLPNFIGEAMASGVPCIVSDVGDAGILVGETGLIIPPRSPEAMSAALIRMIDEGQQGRFRLGQAARARIREGYDLKSAISRYRELLFSVIEKTN
jgi:glycosyltransferase involved in cell wall biosynthesis